MDSEKISLLIIGATGQLGTLITTHCLLKSNLLVNILIRNPDKNTTLCKNPVEKLSSQM